MSSSVRVRTSLWRIFALIAGSAIITLYPEIGACVCPIPDTTPVSIQIDPDHSKPPTDIIVNGSQNSPCATLPQAAAFAWQEFIALNWPAVATIQNTEPRDTPDKSRFFGDPSFTGPLVWHTYRGKVEIFPKSNIVAYNSGSSKDYGYDQRPSYSYQGDGVKIKLPLGGDTPWINLDENSQIGLNKIYAGVVSSTPQDTKAQILFMAKANRAEYTYITANQWWAPPTSLFQRTALFVKQTNRDPQANSINCDGQLAQGNPPTKNCVSLPNGSIEVKAGWRRLTKDEAKSGRFYTTQVRHYINPSNDVGSITAVDEPMGLVGLHIIQKTPTAPYFIYATFEQADNITAADGSPIEDEDGNYRVLINTPPMTPDIVSQNAGPGKVQKFMPVTYPTDPGKQLYYQNISGSDYGLLGGGIILVNKRINDIPPEIVSINKLAHAAILSYTAKKTPTGKSVWMNYKLVNVQYVPIGGKVSGIDDYPRSTYYQSNSVIETDYNLQKFSGEFVDFGNKEFNITDFQSKTNDEQTNYADLLNVAHNGGAVNMGGCMGCHGNSQKAGGDFSFILFDAPVLAPEWDSKLLSDPRFLRFAGYPKRQ